MGTYLTIEYHRVPPLAQAQPLLIDRGFGNNSLERRFLQLDPKLIETLVQTRSSEQFDDLFCES